MQEENKNTARGWGCIFVSETERSTVSNLKKRNKKIALMLTVVTIIAIVAALVAILFKGSEEHISEEKKHDTINVLDCKTIMLVNPILTSSTAIGTEHHIKLEFIGDSFDKANYTYTGTYRSNEEAGKDLSLLHADYNIYMGKIGIYQEDLYPTFSTIDSKNIINLYIPKKFLNTGTAKFIFLNEEELSELERDTIEETQMMYKDKGFSCNATSNFK